MELGINGRLSGVNYQGAAERRRSQEMAAGWIACMAAAAQAEYEKNAESGLKSVNTTGSAESGLGPASVADGAASAEKAQTGEERSEAARIYEAAAAGKENPLSNLRQAPKVPYGYLAKDGVIEYNGVVFVCDEKTNSICLGDVSDPKQVITVALSGGGCLRVNRDSLGALSKAVGMFSPEDLNLIMRAIAQDTKIQSMKREIDDMENSIGNEADAEGQESGEKEKV